MTANRWWVRMAARWLARIDGVTGQLRLLFLAMTGYGITLQTLAQYGLGNYALEFLVTTGCLLTAYTYYYTEGGVWNQTARDKTDMSDNYSGPTMLMDARIEAKQLAYLAHVLQNGESHDLDELVDGMERLTEEEWQNLRSGVNEEVLKS